MKLSVGKWLKRILVSSLMVVFGIALCVLLLLKSEWLFTKIEREVEAATGYKLQLDDKASLTAVFPRLGISVPSLVLRSASPQSSLRRMRLNDVKITLPFKHITGNYLDNLTINAGSLTAILEKVVEKEAAASDVLPVVNVEKLLEQVMVGVSDANLSVSLDELQLIIRDSSGESTIYRTGSNQLSLTADSFHFNGIFEHAGNRHKVSLQHQFSTAVDGISSELSVDFTSDSEKPRSYSLNSRQEVSGREIEIEKFSVVGPQLNIFGQLQLAFEERYRVAGELEVRQLELADLPSINSQQLNGAVRSKDSATTPLFSDHVVDPGQYADIDLSVALGAVRLNNQPIMSGDFIVSGTREHFSLQSAALLLLGGQGQFAFDASAAEEGRNITVDADVNRAQLSRLQITQDDRLLFTSGEADIKMSMKSSGSTQRQLARSLTGYFMLGSSDIEVSQRYAEALDQGIVSFVVRSISNLRKAEPPPDKNNRRQGSLPLACASLKLVVNEGRLEVINGLIIDLPDNVLISSGFIDLHSESLGFAFRTKKKKILDWSAMSLVKFIELGGKLTKPRLSLDRQALLKQGLLSSSSLLVGSLPPLVYRLADAGLRAGERIECIDRLGR